MQRRKLFGILSALVFGTMGFAASASADFVIEARTAAIRTEGGPNAGGGWNLWTNGRVGQPLRFKTAGTSGLVVRAWGSSDKQDCSEPWGCLERRARRPGADRDQYGK